MAPRWYPTPPADAGWHNRLTMLEPVLAVLALLGVFAGAFIAWLAARDVAGRDAKRRAYAEYIGAVDVYGQKLLRMKRSGFPGHKQETASMPDATHANAAIAGLLVLAPRETADLSHAMQQCLADLSVEVARGTYYNRKLWEQRSADFWTLRRQLVERARQETGADTLPDDFWTPPEEAGGHAGTSREHGPQR